MSFRPGTQYNFFNHERNPYLPQNPPHYSQPHSNSYSGSIRPSSSSASSSRDTAPAKREAFWNGRRIGYAVKGFFVCQLIGIIGIPAAIFFLGRALVVGKDTIVKRKGRALNARQTSLQMALVCAVISIPLAGPGLAAYLGAKQKDFKKK